MNVLFVCTGNTCRSPMAEVLGRAEGRARGLSKLSCASAGTFAFAGRPASGPGVAVAEAHGLDLSEHRSRELSLELLEWADVIVGMEPSHAEVAARWEPRASVHVMTDFLPREEAHMGGGGDRGPEVLVGPRPGVPDPYGGDMETYAATWALLERAMQGFFDWLRDTGRTSAKS